MEQLHTESEPSDGVDNHVVVKFQAMMVDIETNLNGEDAAITNTPYYIVAGAEYGNGAYIWVEHFAVEVQKVTHVSPINNKAISIRSGPSWPPAARFARVEVQSWPECGRQKIGKI